MTSDSISARPRIIGPRIWPAAPGLRAMPSSAAAPRGPGRCHRRARRCRCRGRRASAMQAVVARRGPGPSRARRRRPSPCANATAEKPRMTRNESERDEDLDGALHGESPWGSRERRLVSVVWMRVKRCRKTCRISAPRARSPCRCRPSSACRTRGLDEADQQAEQHERQRHEDRHEREERHDDLVVGHHVAHEANATATAGARGG